LVASPYTQIDMPTNVALLLRESRLAAGLTQADLAERALTSQPAVAAYESGRRTPVLSTLARLLAACGREIVLSTQALDAKASLDSLLRQRRADLLAAGLAHGVSNLRVFGSTARGGESGDSDIDLLVDLEPGRTLVDLAAFREDAATVLGVPVDVATLDLLKPRVRDEVVREARTL
jgi:predicted nucleotidyltransferase/DNA-binding XRE family transcriptional regulator